MQLQTTFGLIIAALIPAMQAGAAPPEIGEIRSGLPEALIPGCVTPVFDREPFGYLVCSLVARHFEDETVTDLQAELDLAARLQFLRFMAVGRRDQDTNASVSTHRVRSLRVWWEDDALYGLYYFVLTAQTGGTTDTTETSAAKDMRQPAGAAPTAAALLLEARASRMRGDYSSARDTLERLRREYPRSPEARRTLRELFFVNTEESRRKLTTRRAP
jgi:hypothetical protein